jgi:hypothetical protein
MTINVMDYGLSRSTAASKAVSQSTGLARRKKERI